MRERFSEINITGTGNPIPVGAEAKNIMLNDGSILEEALGDINFQENGSIIEQINKVDNRVQRDANYAPLTAPRLKNALSVRRYNKDNILASVPVVGETKRGITAIYNNNLYQWKISGVITAGNNTTLLLYGGDDYSTQLATTSDYLVTIKTNLNGALSGTAQSPITSLRFDLYNSTSGQTTSVYVYSEDETKDFTIPANTFLYRICLNIYSGNENFTIENGILRFELKNLNDQEQDTYNVVFDVQQDLTDKTWTTTVAENFVVSKGLQSEARSSLGTIYDSKWEGNFNISGHIGINAASSGRTGILINEGSVSFSIEDINNYTGTTIAQKAADQRSKTLPFTSYFIAPMYLNDGTGLLRYGAKEAHDFYVGTNTLGGMAQFTITAGSTKIRNTLELNNQKVVSSQLSLCKSLSTFKDIEDLLLDNNIYQWRPMLFLSAHVLGSWLAWRDQYTNPSVGIGWRVINPDNEYVFQGFAMSAMDGQDNFVGNPGLFKFRYSFYPNATNKKRKFISYKVFNANPATINQYVQVRLGNGMGSDGFWSSYSRANSTTA